MKTNLVFLLALIALFTKPLAAQEKEKIKVPCEHLIQCAHTTPCTHVGPCSHVLPCSHPVQCVHRVQCSHCRPCQHIVMTPYGPRTQHVADCMHPFDVLHAADPMHPMGDIQHPRGDVQHPYDLMHEPHSIHAFDYVERAKPSENVLTALKNRLDDFRQRYSVIKPDLDVAEYTRRLEEIKRLSTILKQDDSLANLLEIKSFCMDLRFQIQKFEEIASTLEQSAKNLTDSPVNAMLFKQRAAETREQVQVFKDLQSKCCQTIDG